MNPTEFNKLEEYQHEIARLQKRFVKFNRKLAVLPGKHGFKTMGEFIDALKRAAAETSKMEGAKGKTNGRRRAKITPEVKQKVKSMAAAEKTGVQIAKELGISVPSVQNIKKELGLVKKRKG